MIIIPAVDVLGGRCVRLVQGKKENETVYDNDPVAMGRRWASYGIKRLHVVDLDGAFEKESEHGRADINTTAIEAIIREVKVPVEIGGGLRTKQAVQRVFEAGAAYAIIGTVAVKDPDECRSILSSFPDRVYVGIDAQDGMVAIHGWKEITDRSALDLADEVAKYGARGIIYTDISRDGTLAGPNLEALAQMAVHSKIPIIASGGISCVDDLVNVNKLPNVEGVITGKALYDGRIDLEEALALESFE